jgi:hypothetical protein
VLLCSTTIMSISRACWIAFAVLLCSCDVITERHQQTQTAQDSRSQAASRPSATTTAATVGRFIVFQSVGPSGSNVTLRIDTSTGETWRLELARAPEWVPVKDHLQAIGTHNPATNQMEWSTKLPDGRDLRDLSKEELIRWVEPIIRASGSTNPKDPLGLFENDDPPESKK